MNLRPVNMKIPFRAILLWLLTASCAQATNMLTNGSFDSTSLGSIRRFTTGQNISGWTVVGPAVLLINGNYREPYHGASFNAEDGPNALDITGVGNEGTSAGVWQTISTVMGQDYSLSFFVGRASSTNNSVAYANPASIDLSIDNGARTTYTNSNSNTILGLIDWQEFTTVFTANSTITKISFYNAMLGLTSYAGLDNVSLSPVTLAAVPEPAMTGLLGTGIGLLWMIRRRKSEQETRLIG